VYISLAQCYEATGNYPKAEQDYLVAMYIQPDLLQPKFSLMNLYLKMKDTSKAKFEARTVMSTDPKIQSAETNFYKYKARLLLISLGSLYSNTMNKRFDFRGKPYFTRKKI